MGLYLADLYTHKVCWHHWWTNIHNLSDLFVWICLLSRCYNELIDHYYLESAIIHPSFQLYMQWLQGMLLL